MSGVAGLVVSEARGRGASRSRRTRSCSWCAPRPTTSTSRRPNAVDPANDFLTGATVRYPSTRRAGTRPTATAGSTPTSSSRRCATRGSRPRPTSRARAGSRCSRRTAPSTCAATSPRPRRRVLVPRRVGRRAAAAGASRRRHVARGRRQAAPHRRRPTAPRHAGPRVGRRRARRRVGPARRSARPVAPTRRSSACGSASSSPPRAAPTDGLVGESQKQVFVHDDPDLVAGYAARRPGRGHVEPGVRRPRARRRPRRWCSPPTTVASTCCAPT